MGKRSFDIFLSVIALIILLPIFIMISIIIIIDSRGGVFYQQIRVGLKNTDFAMFKFRTMYPNSDKKGLLTVGLSDNRVTKAGRFLRKYKLDELPQLINILIGDMSFVGPRPEVRKYVDLYSDEQRKVLLVKPGLTDFASLEYIDESDILAISDNPEQTYIQEIMPSKIKLNFKYIEQGSMMTDLKILTKTVLKIIR